MSVKKVEFEPTAVDQGQMREEQERLAKAEAAEKAAKERLEALELEARTSAALAAEEEFKRKVLTRKPLSTKEELIRALPYEKARDREMVTGTFHNLESRGTPAEFNLHLYDDDGFEHWSFADGEKATIPYGVAWHINNNCHTLEYIELKDEFGRPTGLKAGIGGGDGKSKQNKMEAYKKIFRFQFLVPGAPADMYPTGLVEVSTRNR